MVSILNDGPFGSQLVGGWGGADCNSRLGTGVKTPCKCPSYTPNVATTVLLLMDDFLLAKVRIH